MKQPPTPPTPKTGTGSRSGRDDSTLKNDSRSGKKKKKKLQMGGVGARSRSINMAMNDDRFPIASPSPLKTVYISNSNHPTPKREKLGEKELAILHGAKCRNTDYPTMADIESDWDDKKDGDPRGLRTAEENKERTARSNSRYSEKTDKE